MQKGVFIFSAPIRERIRSNGYVLSSFFKKVGQTKCHFKAFLGLNCPVQFGVSRRGGGRGGKPDLKKCENIDFFESLQISIYR